VPDAALDRSARKLAPLLQPTPLRASACDNDACCSTHRYFARYAEYVDSARSGAKSSVLHRTAPADRPAQTTPPALVRHRPPEPFATRAAKQQTPSPGHLPARSAVNDVAAAETAGPQEDAQGVPNARSGCRRQSQHRSRSSRPDRHLQDHPPQAGPAQRADQPPPNRLRHRPSPSRYRRSRPPTRRESTA